MRVNNLMLSAILLCLGAATHAAELTPAASDTVERYFAALAVGDTSAMAPLLADRMKARIDVLTRNSEYATQLANDNAGRTFQVIDSRATPGGILEVDYVSSDASETITKRLYLIANRRQPGSYLIMEEQVIP